MSRCGLRKLYFSYASVNLYCYFTVNRTNFYAQLAYGKMTFTNVSFMFGWYKVKFLLYFAVAKGFHFPKQPIVHNFHSLLRHLFTSEFAVLLFDCERYKLAAGSIP